MGYPNEYAAKLLAGIISEELPTSEAPKFSEMYKEASGKATAAELGEAVVHVFRMCIARARKRIENMLRDPKAMHIAELIRYCEYSPDRDKLNGIEAFARANVNERWWLAAHTCVRCFEIFIFPCDGNLKQSIASAVDHAGEAGYGRFSEARKIASDLLNQLIPDAVIKL